MKAIENYLIKSIKSENPSKISILILFVFSVILLAKRQEVLMTTTNAKKELDQKKETETQKVSIKDKAKNLLAKTRDAILSEKSEKAINLVGAIVIAIGFTLFLSGIAKTAMLYLLAITTLVLIGSSTSQLLAYRQRA